MSRRGRHENLRIGRREYRVYHCSGRRIVVAFRSLLPAAAIVFIETLTNRCEMNPKPREMANLCIGEA